MIHPLVIVLLLLVLLFIILVIAGVNETIKDNRKEQELRDMIFEKLKNEKQKDDAIKAFISLLKDI